MAPDDLPAAPPQPAPPPPATSSPAATEAPPAATVTPADARARATTAPADPRLVADILGTPPPAAQGLRRQKWFSDLDDRWLFIVVLVVGVTGVMGLKLGPFATELAKWAATAWAAASLLLYAAAAYFLDRRRLRGDRLGDNCYYLGFLLTLASMAAALIQFDLTAGDRGLVLERLIGSFGVALFSTFLGIALRVVFLQFRREVDDLEEEMRRDLQERAELLKGQLLQAVTELESFRLRTRQVLDERMLQVTDLFAEQSRQQMQALMELARQITQEGTRALSTHTQQAMALEDAIREQTTAAAALAERLGRVEVPPDLFTQEIRQLAGRLGQAVVPLEQSAKGLAARMEAIDVPTDWVAARLAPFTAALAQATAAVEHLAREEVARRTALDEATARATAAIDAAANDLLKRPRGMLARLAYLFGWQRTYR